MKFKAIMENGIFFFHKSLWCRNCL